MGLDFSTASFLSTLIGGESVSGAPQLSAGRNCMRRRDAEITQIGRTRTIRDGIPDRVWRFADAFHQLARH
jgi:hypothetical protein